MLAEGGHHYSTFRDGQNPQRLQPQYEMVKAWFSTQQPVAPPGDERIKNLEPVN